MKKIVEEQIMYHKWHEFLYSYETEERTNLLKEMDRLYPVKYEEDAPTGIYLHPYGIEEISKDKEQIDKEKLSLLNIVSREYLKNLIAYHIVSKIENNSIVMGQVEEEMLAFLNGHFFDRDKEVSSVKDYLQELKETLCIYKESYNQVLITGRAHPKMFDLPYFSDIEQFGKKIKELLKNNGQFNILVDYKEPIVLSSAKAIMSIVNSRCAGTICMKVSTTPDSWPTYHDLNGNYVESTNDYGVVELDDSLKKSIDKRKKMINLED